MTGRYGTVKVAILLICVSLLCGFLFVGCNESGEREERKLPRIRIGGSIYEPYFYIDENGEYAGIDVELAREACRRMGYEPVFVTIDWLDKDGLLLDGTIDCAWACFL